MSWALPAPGWILAGAITVRLATGYRRWHLTWGSTAAEATRLAYASDEAAEGRDAFLEKRRPDWSSFPYHF